MFDKRASGILLHPTSFPSRFGIGDLGNEAYRFIDFLADGLQQVWQILPLGPTGFGNSPYLCYSALAGNPLLISPEKLVEDELLSEEDFAGLPDFPLDSVDFELVIQTKMPLLRKACENFKQQASEELQQEFKEFCDRASDWLEDYALFMSLKEVFAGESWNNWDKEIAKRNPDAIAKWQNELKEPIFSQKFLQFQFFRQWNSLKEYANKKQISIFGDIPIYVAHDSVDVWANPDLFCLDEETGEAALMAGVPPDYFSATGQLWGNPVYNWEKHQRTNFAWWIRRVEAILEYVDIVRIDHFRGFEAFWAVPQGEETAIDGEWIEAPGEAFFTLLKQKLGKLPIIAEDLGVITPEVEALRDKFGFPGMKILQFAFDSDRDNAFLPFNFVNRNCVIYTGTHDNDTTMGWFNARTPEEQARVIDYLGCVCPEGIHWSLIRIALSSVANGAIFPFQDLLALGSDARMNTPSVADGNWGWRYRREAINSEVSNHLQYLTYLYGRAPS
ncbi:MAG: 4-alpha-glucanotransferase [Hydrococcus sp. Prado102]|jgi:4-alpha-glucanotransferase|nr:4-alpha-glucanotransferase [Hydrococcus sp. Prado102]